MTQPLNLYILGQRFVVEAVAHVQDDGEELLGFTDVDAGVIKVATDGLSDDRMREAYLHEVLHAVFGLTGLKRYLATKHPSDEEVVTRLAVGLLQTLRENPVLVSILTDGAR